MACVILRNLAFTNVISWVLESLFFPIRRPRLFEILIRGRKSFFGKDASQARSCDENRRHRKFTTVHPPGNFPSKTSVNLF
jgi:hypothetical protein